MERRHFLKLAVGIAAGTGTAVIGVGAAVTGDPPRFGTRGRDFPPSCAFSDPRSTAASGQTKPRIKRGFAVIGMKTPLRADGSAHNAS